MMLIAFKCPFTTPNTPWKITKPCLNGSLTGSLLIMGYLYTTTWLTKESLQWEHFCGLTFSKNRSLLLDVALCASLLARKKQQLWIVMLSNRLLLCPCVIFLASCFPYIWYLHNKKVSLVLWIWFLMCVCVCVFLFIFYFCRFFFLYFGDRIN